MRELVTENMPLKLLALVLAFSLWAALTGQQPLPKDFTVPLSIELDATQTYAAPPPSQVRLRLTGPQSQMRAFDAVGLVARVDLRGRPVGRHEVLLGRPNIDGVPSRITLEFIEPDRVIVVTDGRMRRELPVRPNFRDAPPAGLHVYAARPTPERVTVEGPVSLVEELTEIETDPISLADRTRPFSATVSAAAASPMVTVLGNRGVEVRVVVDAVPVERGFLEVPVVVVGGGEAGDRVTIVPSVVAVDLAGPPQLLERLASAQIRVGVDVSGVRADGRSQRVTVAAEVLELPVEQQQRIRIKTVRPGQVSVRVEPAESAGPTATEPARSSSARATDKDTT